MTRLWQDIRYAARRLQRADLQPRGDRHARLDDRRHDRRVHRRQRGAAARAAVPRSEPAGADAAGLPEDVVRVFAARLPGVRGARRLLRQHRGIPQPRYELSGVEPPERDGHAGVGDALRDPWRAAGARPSLHARRRRGGAAGRRPQRRAVGANICPRSGRDRTSDPARSPALHDRRRHAARLYVSATRPDHQQRSRRRMCRRVHGERTARVRQHATTASSRG